jgi:hypothetical protein
MSTRRLGPAIAFGLLLALAATQARAQETPPPAPPPDAASLELQKARLEVEKARLEADKARAEADKAKTEAAAAKEQAEKQDTRNIANNNNLTLNPLGIIVGGISIGYDRGIADVLTLGGRFIYIAPLLFPFHGVGGEVSLLFWPRHPNNGFFVGPFVQVTKTFPTKSLYIGATVVAPGLKLGWRWMWHSGFNLGLGAGFGWGFKVDQDQPCSNCTQVGGGPSPLLLLDLGYAF